MSADAGQIAGMERSDLLGLWSEMMDGSPPKRLSTPFLRRILAFELQAHRKGGLSPAVVKQLERIGKGIERCKSPIMKPGGRLVREWNGISHVVDVSEDEYLWRGASYRSLSAVARAITGAHWSGPRFFGLTARR